MTVRTYSSPAAFKQALEQRLRTTARSGAAFARQRQILVFQRFLARVAIVLGDARTFLDPVLAGRAAGTWDPVRWTWTA